MRIRVTAALSLSAFLLLACSGDSPAPVGPTLDTPELSLSAQLADLEALISAAGDENFEWTEAMEALIARVHHRFDAGLGSIKPENDDGLSRTLQGARSLSPAALIVVPDDQPSPGVAVGAASPGDVIVVKGGTYYEFVGINKPNLTLIGIGATVVGGIYVIETSGVTVAGFQIQVGNPSGERGLRFQDSPNGKAIANTVTGVPRAPAIFCFRSTDCRVIGNRALDSQRGVTVGASGDSPANGVVYGNVVRGNEEGGVTVQTRGITGQGQPQNVGTDVAFNRIESNGIGVWIRIFVRPGDPPADPPDGTIIRHNRFKCNSEDIVDEGTNTVIRSNRSSC